MSQEALEGIVLAQAIISVVSDFAFAALPVIFLWRVQIDTRTKLGLWGLMCLGVLTGSFCLVRTVLNDEALPKDATYAGIINWLWRLFEVQVGIIAACVPTLRPLYVWAVKWFAGQRSTLNTNIKMLSSEKTQPWVESVEKSRSRRGTMAVDESRSRDRRDGRRDTLHDELVREGIITRQLKDIEMGMRDKNELQRQETSRSLGHEMQKYGIDDSR